MLQWGIHDQLLTQGRRLGCWGMATDVQVGQKLKRVERDEAGISPPPTKLDHCPVAAVPTVEGFQCNTEGSTGVVAATEQE